MKKKSAHSFPEKQYPDRYIFVFLHETIVGTNLKHFSGGMRKNRDSKISSN